MVFCYCLILFSHFNLKLFKLKPKTVIQSFDYFEEVNTVYKNQKMKNLIIVLSVFLAVSTIATAQTTTKSSKEALRKITYTCSMHPEIISSKKGKCPKCGMKLIEKSVIKNDVSIKKNQTKAIKTKIYACPMHPKSQGKLNDKCPKCGMKLTEEVK